MNYNNNNNNNNNSNNDNKYKGTIVETVTKIKEDGNNLFRSSKYEEAIKKYYEAIEEIKTTIDKDKYKNELDDIERTCRLNIANSKLKTKDYDGVINEKIGIFGGVDRVVALFVQGRAHMIQNAAYGCAPEFFGPESFGFGVVGIIHLVHFVVR